MRLAISGPRDLDLSNEDILYALMRAGWAPHYITCIIEGGAKGVDKAARAFGHKHNITVHTEKAEWTLYNPSKLAGPYRNMKMATDEEIDAEALLAFRRRGKPVTGGTASAIAEFFCAGLPIYVAEVG